MFDSHCHLNFKAFVNDAPAIAKAMAKRSTSALVVGCDPVSSRSAIDLAQTFPNLWASVGTHPIHALDSPWDPILMLDLASKERVVAIGEVGLDFYRIPDGVDQATYLEAQYTIFKAAIALAKLVDKPLVIHARNSYDEIITVLTEAFPKPASPNTLRGTIHCFMGDWAQAQALLNLGFMIGFTGVITYADAATSLIEVVKQVPLDRLLIETDAPYLTPEPYRSEGKVRDHKTPRNEPQFTEAIAKMVAKLRDLSPDKIIEITETNARRLFKI